MVIRVIKLTRVIRDITVVFPVSLHKRLGRWPLRVFARLRCLRHSFLFFRSALLFLDLCEITAGRPVCVDVKPIRVIRVVRVIRVMKVIGLLGFIGWLGFMRVIRAI
jgi:hypothetical protein